MSKKKQQFGADSPDPRTRVGKTVRVGDSLKGSRVTHVKQERKSGRNGYRIRLADGRSAWCGPDTKVNDVRFDLPQGRAQKLARKTGADAVLSTDQGVMLVEHKVQTR